MTITTNKIIRKHEQEALNEMFSIANKLLLAPYIIGIILCYVALFIGTIFITWSFYPDYGIIAINDNKIPPQSMIKHKIPDFKEPNINNPQDKKIIESYVRAYVTMENRYNEKTLFKDYKILKSLNIPKINKNKIYKGFYINFKLLNYFKNYIIYYPKIKNIIFIKNNIAEINYYMKLKKLNLKKSLELDLSDMGGENFTEIIKFKFKDLARTDFEYQKNPYNFQVYSVEDKK